MYVCISDEPDGNLGGAIANLQQQIASELLEWSRKMYARSQASWLAHRWLTRTWQRARAQQVARIKGWAELHDTSLAELSLYTIV